MSGHHDISTDRTGLDRLRAIIELIGVATLTITQIVSAATTISGIARCRRASCR